MKTFTKLLFIVLVGVFATTLSAKEEVIGCNDVIKKDPVDKNLVKSICFADGEKYKDKKYGEASWCYIFADAFDQSIAMANKSILEDKEFFAAANAGHSTLLKGDIATTKAHYSLFLKHINDDKAMQEDFQLLLKHFPDKATLIHQGMAVWNQMHLPYSETASLKKKYKEQKKQKDYQGALETLAQLLTISKNLGEDSLALSDVYGYFSTVYDTMGDHRTELKYRIKGLEIQEKVLGADHPDTLQSMSNLTVYSDLGRDADALVLQEKVVALSEKVLGAEHPHTLTSMNNLAYTYGELGRHADALVLEEKVRALREKVLGAENPDTLTSMNNLAYTYGELGRHADALVLEEKVLALREKVSGAEHPDTLISMGNLARSYGKLGRDADAVALLSNRNERYERWFAVQQGVLTPEEQQQVLEKNRPTLNNHLRLLAKQDQGQEALVLADRNKARYLLAQLSQQNALDKANISVADRQAYDQLRQTLLQVNERLAKAERDQTPLAELQKQQRDLLQQQSQLIKRLQDTYPVFAQYSRPKTLDLDQARSLMQQHLPKGSVVSFWQDGELNDSYLAFVMSADGKVVTQRIKKDNLKRSLQAYREIAAFHGSVIDYMKTRKSLWRHADGSFEVSFIMPAKLTFKDRVTDMEPLQKYISESLLGPIWSNIADAKSLLISPDSDLALVAFEALTTPNGKRLIEEKDISYTPSLSIWINTHQRQASYDQRQRHTLLALANPDYSQQQSDQKVANSSLPMTTQRGQTVQRDQLFWKDLPGSEVEAKRIASIYPDLTLKTGKDASKHWLVEQNQTGTLKQYKQLHFATHGYLDDSDPMQSSLVLSFDQGKAQAYLSAQDIYKLDLQSDLTVLSACNTAANEAKAGVGVVGLPFALYMAGNQSTLMTLWSVNDEATAAYMQRFHELVKQGIKPAQANSQVKREFLTQAKYAGVNIWAPFVYYGN